SRSLAAKRACPVRMVGKRVEVRPRLSREKIIGPNDVAREEGDRAFAGRAGTKNRHSGRRGPGKRQENGEVAGEVLGGIAWWQSADPLRSQRWLVEELGGSDVAAHGIRVRE